MRVVGALSGTSMNAKEFLMCEIDSRANIKPLDYFSEKYGKQERYLLSELTSGRGDISKIALAHDIVGISFSSSLRRFLKETRFKPAVIGFHGQTVFHQEVVAGEHSIKKVRALTLQIGEPCFLSYVANAPVVYDFRKSDISAGGRGAPLSPVIHYVLFRKLGSRVCVVNLGGIANVSVIEGDAFSRLRGFDVGPANALSDFIAKQKLKMDFDPHGRYAERGNVLEDAYRTLYQFLKDKRLHKRTLGKEIESAKELAMKVLEGERAEDSIRTVLEVSVTLISEMINKLKPSLTILCGGGVRNLFFVKRIREESKGPVVISDEVGVKSEYVEPMLFGFLSYLRIKNKRIQMKNVTGAMFPYLPGKICSV